MSTACDTAVLASHCHWLPCQARVGKLRRPLTLQTLTPQPTMFLASLASEASEALPHKDSVSTHHQVTLFLAGSLL